MKIDKDLILLEANGDVVFLRRKGFFKRMMGLFKDKLPYDIEVYSLNRKYTIREQNKINSLQGLLDFSDPEDVKYIINHIRPNTIKQDITEIKTSNYYKHVEETPDISLLRAIK